MSDSVYLVRSSLEYFYSPYMGSQSITGLDNNIHLTYGPEGNSFFSQKSSDVFQDESYGKNKQTKCHAGNNCAIVSQLGYIWIWSGARDQQSTNQCAHFVVWKSSDITIVNIFHTLWKNEVLRE